MLLTSKSLRAVLQQSQKAAEPSLAALRLSVADGWAYRSPTEPAVGTDEPATGVSPSCGSIVTHGGAFLLQNYVFSGFLDFIVAATPLRDPFTDPVPDIPVAENGSDLHFSGSSVFRLAIDPFPVA